MKKISLLIPCYNEEASIPLLYDQLIDVTKKEANYQWSFLFINDGSKDNTLQIIKKLRESDSRIAYIDLSRNFGKENAMMAGIDFVTGDAVIIMDADLQHPPGILPEMINFWEQGFDDVYAKKKSRGKESWLRKQFSLSFYRLLKQFSRIEIPENVGDFRLLDRKCIDALKTLRETERYTKGLFAFIGFKKKEICFDTEDRKEGKSSWNFFSLLKLAITGITSFSVAPLKIAILFGLLVSFVSFIYLIFVIVKTIFYGEIIQGYPTIITLILFIGGIQLFCIGIIGEYIGQIFLESKKRPAYLVQEYQKEGKEEKI